MLSTQETTHGHGRNGSDVRLISTLKDDGFTLSINAVDDSVAALIKAKKGTQYEYVVGEVCEQEKMLYDGLDIKNLVSYIAGGTSLETNTLI